MNPNQGRIVVHPKVVDRSERLGIGRTVCKNIDTGEVWEEYDLERIEAAERRLERMISRDFTIQGYLALSIIYAVAKKRAIEYLSKI